MENGIHFLEAAKHLTNGVCEELAPRIIRKRIRQIEWILRHLKSSLREKAIIGCSTEVRSEFSSRMRIFLHAPRAVSIYLIATY